MQQKGTARYCKPYICAVGFFYKHFKQTLVTLLVVESVVGVVYLNQPGRMACVVHTAVWPPFQTDHPYY